MRLSLSARLALPAAALATLLLALPAGAAEVTAPAPKRDEPRGPFDIRAGAGSPEAPAAAQAALRRALGVQGVVDVDPLTGTPRVVAKLDGFLTGPSSRDAKEIALDYVRAHPAVFKLDENDLAGLRLTRDYTDARGTRHLVWAQTYGGISAFDNDLRANVASDGRLLNVLGSPLPDLAPATTVPRLDAGGALTSALRSVGRSARAPRVLTRGSDARRTTRFAGGHRANLVFFNDGRQVRLAWGLTAHADSDEVYDSVVDAASGEVLQRANKVADATGKAWDYYPGAANGGVAGDVDFTVEGWLTSATRLEGPFARVFTDWNDDDAALVSEEIGPAPGGNWDYAFDSYDHASGFCAPSPGFTSTCSWNSATDWSWGANREQNATQVFHFVNTFHDHLAEDASIAFDSGSGNFENGDRVVAHSDDGAATSGGSPDPGHRNNANMLTPPDGTSPRMQMYLFASSGQLGDTTPDVNGGDDAAVVYHEYTHGLSNRLITYSNGWGALETWQSAAMGEGWSDWYAMDFLVAQGFAADAPDTDGEVTLDRYVGNGAHSLRSEGLDCPLGPATAECPAGGYTYGDFGRIYAFGPEVHADGEIWGQTLWDLREAVGVADARLLVTDGMRLSPPNPSFLDMRNAILQADTAAGTGHRDAIWTVFAARGMGYFAHAASGNDVEPTEDFTLPPDPLVTGSLSGTVVDAHTGKPVAGAVVYAGDRGTTTNGLGAFSFSSLPAATYPRIVASKTGYDEAVASNVVLAAGANGPLALPIRRDWASVLGGARVTALSGTNYSYLGCGPYEGIDQALVTGWSSDAGAPRSMTVRLPAYVDVRGFAVDPGATCGDADSASLAGYRIEVSKTGAGNAWAVVSTGTFGGLHNHQLNQIAIATRRAVRYVRVTMLSNQGDPDFVDLSELEVYGVPTPLCMGLPATRVGTDAAQRITGSRGADVIAGLGGGDRIDGRGGNDVICGGPGNDQLIGGRGADKFDAGEGNDTIYARDGVRERTIKGGPGRDRARKDPRDRLSSVERLF